MFGYEPQKPDHQPGSWGETWMLVRIVLIELGRPLLIMVGLIALVVSVFVFLFTNPLISLLPLSVLGYLGYRLVRKDREAIQHAEDALPPPPRYR